MTRRALPASGSLYLVATTRASLPQSDFLARVEAALAGGADVVQLRATSLGALDTLRLAEKVGALAAAAGVPFIVNDRPDVALAAGADGVHLGQADLPPESARRVLPGAIVGRSTHSLEQFARAEAERADYAGVGPVWETPTKPGRAAVGLEYVRDVAARRSALPWFAIGGITLDNIESVLDAGATRVAVVRAVLDARDPAEAAAGFRAALGARSGALGPARAGTIRLNGEKYPHRDGLTLRALLEELGVDARKVVVMHGDEIHRAGRVPDAPVAPGDTIEIVTMMQGG
ncbi:MAG TPA: thiamine phosphate synthase [Gemmatimonadaceae bacterium]